MFGCIEAEGEEREEKRAKEGKWGKKWQRKYFPMCV